MQIKITCRGCEHTPDLDKYIHQKFKRVEEFLKHVRSPISLEVLVEMHNVHQHHIITARLHAPNYKCMAQHEGPELFAEINEVSDRLIDQVRDHKEKMVDQKKHGCDGECRAEHFEKVADEIYDEDDE